MQRTAEPHQGRFGPQCNSSPSFAQCAAPHWTGPLENRGTENKCRPSKDQVVVHEIDSKYDLSADKVITEKLEEEDVLKEENCGSQWE